MPGSFAAPMKPRIEDAASSAPIKRNCFFGVSSIGCVTMPALSSKDLCLAWFTTPDHFDDPCYCLTSDQSQASDDKAG